MKTIYLDKEYRCHVTNDGTMRAVETNIFDGKCDAYIEGYRYVPAGEIWVREDGVVFYGEMIAPWMDHSLLVAAQADYLEKLVADMRAAYAKGVASA